jgi:hypothetical protein
MTEVHRRVRKVVIRDTPWMGTNQRKRDWDDQKHKDLDDKAMESSPN